MSTLRTKANRFAGAKRGGQGRIFSLKGRVGKLKGGGRGVPQTQSKALATLEKKYGIESVLNASLGSVIDTLPLSVLAQLGKIAVATRRQAYGLQVSKPTVRTREDWERARAMYKTGQQAGWNTIVREAKLSHFGRRGAADIVRKRGTMTTDIKKYVKNPLRMEFKGVDDGSAEAVHAWIQRIDEWNDAVSNLQRDVSGDEESPGRDIIAAEIGMLYVPVLTARERPRSAMAIITDFFMVLDAAPPILTMQALANNGYLEPLRKVYESIRGPLV